MRGIFNLIIIVAICLFGVIYSFAEKKNIKNRGLEIVASPRFKLDYSGKYGAEGTADKIKAYLENETLVGEATLLELSKNENGGIGLTIEETYYDDKRPGKVIYKGLIVLNTKMEKPIREKVIKGEKTCNIFTSWVVFRVHYNWLIPGCGYVQ